MLFSKYVYLYHCVNKILVAKGPNLARIIYSFKHNMSAENRVCAAIYLTMTYFKKTTFFVPATVVPTKDILKT